MAAGVTILTRMGSKMRGLFLNAGSLHQLANRVHISAAMQNSGTVSDEQSFRFVVCGGGTGGLAVASTLARRFGDGSVAVVEPSEVSFHAIVSVLSLSYYCHNYTNCNTFPHLVCPSS